jgi:carboxymethylenebutenolidase
MGRMIELTADDGHIFSAYRTGNDTAPRGLIIGQEIFGVNPHIRHIADIFAAAGYTVIAPALFDRVERHVELGYNATDIMRGRDIREQIAETDLVRDVTAAARALGHDTIAMVGYCWGATVAWQIACATSLLQAAVCWYGAGIAGMAGRPPHCPVQMHLGEHDASIPPADIAKIRVAHPEIKINIYAHAGHGFGCAARESFVPAAYDLAQERTFTFLNRFMAH